MIILPESNLNRAATSKLLMPMAKCKWRAPSQRKAIHGIEDKTRWLLTARLSDGHAVWRGWFDDREDADAFLCALASGSLIYERELWDLPIETWIPAYGYGRSGWRPDLGEGLIYEFATTSFLTTTNSSNQTYNIPSDWNSASNFVIAIAAGGGGGMESGARLGAVGGGGGEYRKSVNLSLTPGGTAAYRLDVGGAGATSSGTSGGNGTDCWFNSAAFPSTGQAVGAKAGVGGGFDGTTGGTGGTGGYSTGTGAANSSGGQGGNGSGSGGAGAGAGGPLGTGGAGGSSTGSGAGRGAGGGGNGGGSVGGSSTSSSTGAAGGNNNGGTGGGAAHANGTNGGGGGGGSANTGGNGGPGIDLDASHGSGGGGGQGGTDSNGGSGGLYGGGGGGGGDINGNGGTGGQALIGVNYTPGLVGGFNLAMIGM